MEKMRALKEEYEKLKAKKWNEELTLEDFLLQNFVKNLRSTLLKDPLTQCPLEVEVNSSIKAEVKNVSDPSDLVNQFKGVLEKNFAADSFSENSEGNTHTITIGKKGSQTTIVIEENQNEKSLEVTISGGTHQDACLNHLIKSFEKQSYNEVEAEITLGSEFDLKDNDTINDDQIDKMTDMLKSIMSIEAKNNDNSEMNITVSRPSDIKKKITKVIEHLKAKYHTPNNDRISALKELAQNVLRSKILEHNGGIKLSIKRMS